MKTNTQRVYIIGGNWLYYKIYTGSKTSDLILTEIIKPVTELLIKNNVIDKWFFVRYADPEHHLRIRFHFRNRKSAGTIISAVYDSLNEFFKQDLIWKIQIDTYTREIERYGEKTIDYSEELFYNNSKMIIELLNLIEDSEEEIRWLFGLRAIDHLLATFKFTNEQKLELLESLKLSFGKEFGMARPLKKQLDDKYRNEREKIEVFLKSDSKESSEIRPLIMLLENEAEENKKLAEKILYLSKNKELHISLNELISSYIHMLTNRLFRSNNRLHEMVIYDFLFRYYKSKWAKLKYRIKT